MRRTGLPALLLVISFASCTPKEDREGSKHVRSERERDSILGASRLPGATGVRRALDVSDSAAARNARLDSVANQ